MDGDSAPDQNNMRPMWNGVRVAKTNSEPKNTPKEIN